MLEGETVRRVTIIASHKGDRDLEKLRGVLEIACKERGWTVKTRRVTVVNSLAAGESRRPYSVLEPADAYELYKDLHQGPTAVLQLVGSQVQLNPLDGAKKSNLISLQTFVRHKGIFRDVKAGSDVASVLGGIDQELKLFACTGERDPRCLPMHCFSPGSDWPILDGAEALKSFEAVHGPPARRIDSAKRQWAVAKARHGGEPAYVRGYMLLQGFHWDVQGLQGAGLRIFNSREVWKVPKGTYLNVAPNADIRKGATGSSASVEYCAKRPDPELAKAKANPKGRKKKRS